MATDPIDLTTVAAVKSWIAPAVLTGEDSLIQSIITAFSAYVLHLTGRGPADGSIPVKSPFNEDVEYDDWYDGNGNDRLFLRNWPITEVESVSINGVALSASSGPNNPGYVIDASRKSLVRRGGAYAAARGGYSRPIGFSLGAQNINVVYTAGFAATPQDLELCARKCVALEYKRRGWIGQSSQAMAAGAGTVNFTKWEMDDECRRVIEYYAARVA